MPKVEGFQKVREPLDTDFGQVTPDNHRLEPTGQEKQMVHKGKPEAGIECRVTRNFLENNVLGTDFFPLSLLSTWYRPYKEI